MLDASIEEVLHRVSGGGAICFLGAGFSTEATDADGLQLPSTSKLEEEICKMIGVDRESGGSLTDLAEYCQARQEFAPKFRLLLVRRLTSTQPSASQRRLLNAPWRAVFTTNFDDVVERCIDANRLQVVRPQSDVNNIVAGRLPLYHLHGRARDLAETDIDPLIVVSETNYLELRNRNKPLHSAFLNELHCATQVVFIGYSLRDADIASRLFELSDTLRSKSFVVCHPKDGDVAKTRLQKFGDVQPIGLTGFVEAFPSSFVARDDIARLETLSFVRRVPKAAAAEAVEKRDVDSMMMTGKLSYRHFARQRADNDFANPYCVERTEKLEQIFSHYARGANKIVVSSDIGNGKTTFLGQLEWFANDKGYDVFRVTSNLPEATKELEYLLTRKSLQLFVVDDLPRLRPVAKFIAQRLSKLGLLVCGDRNVVSGDYEDDLEETLHGQYANVELDELSASELSNWDKLLERWGFWGNQLDVADEDRLKFLREKCSGETRSIVVSLFHDSRLAAMIEDVVAFFCTRYPRHRRAFIGMLIASLCQGHVSWHQIVDWLRIDEQALKRDIQNEKLFDFMADGRDWHSITSSQLAHHIFATVDVGDDMLVDTYTTIVRETAYSSNDPRSGADSGQNLKELMKYRFLTKLFGRTSDSTGHIEAVYQRLSGAPKIRENDQFWLQYAMANMDLNRLPEAETYIGRALQIAEAKGPNYSKHQIFDQRSRLLLKKNTQKKGDPNATEIDRAVKDLQDALTKSGPENAIYPLRSAEHIDDLVNAKGDKLSPSSRHSIEGLLVGMQNKSSVGKLRKAARGEQKKLDRCIKSALAVLKAE
ncbi:MAG: SIR2 family protein [Hyphomicrobiaceae bacterium]